MRGEAPPELQMLDYCVYVEYDDLSPGVLYASVYDRATQSWFLTSFVAPRPGGGGSQAVSYPQGYPARVPANYESDCAALRCTAWSSANPAAAGEACADCRYCETTDGGENCIQFIYLRAMHYWAELICDPECYPDRTKHYFQAFVLATEDLYDGASKDELGFIREAPLTSFGDAWIWSWRTYKWPAQWDFSNGKCLYAVSEIDGGGAEVKTGIGSATHTSMFQSIGKAPDFCRSRNGTTGGTYSAHKALFEASVVWKQFETQYHNQPGRMEVTLGHRRTTGEPSWSCGVPPGCGFTVSPKEANAWEARARTNFWY